MAVRILSKRSALHNSKPSIEGTQILSMNDEQCHNWGDNFPFVQSVLLDMTNGSRGIIFFGNFRLLSQSLSVPIGIAKTKEQP